MLAAALESSENFYVQALQPPIEPCAFREGDRMLPLSQIPGRDRTFVLDENETEEKEKEEKTEEKEKGEIEGTEKEGAGKDEGETENEEEEEQDEDFKMEGTEDVGKEQREMVDFAKSHKVRLCS